MSNSPHQRNRILLVEDEALISISEKKTLERHGYEVIPAYSGEQAVEIARRDTGISLVLMDIDLGEGIDGTKAAEQLLTLRPIPIVFLTSHSEKEYVHRVKKITSYGYVLKNSGEFVLIQSIDMALSLFRSKQNESDKEEELRQQNEYLEFYRLAVDAMDDHKVSVVDSDYRYRVVSRRYSRDAGLPKEKIVGKTVAELHGNDAFQAIKPDIDQCFAGEVVEYSRWFEYPEAGRRYMDVSYYPLRNRRREIDSIAVIVKDNTERKELEDTLRESRKQLETIFDSARDAIFIHDLHGNFLKVNNTTCEALGYSKEELFEMNVFDIDTTVHGLTNNEIVGQLQRDHVSYLETEHVKKGGESFPVETSLVLIEYYGNPAVLCIARNLTDRKQFETQIQEKNGLLHSIMEHVPSGLFVKDRETRFIVANTTALASLGVTTKDDVIGKTDFAFLSRTYAEKTYAIEREVIATGTPHVEEERQGIDDRGVIRWVVVRRAPFIDDADGSIKGVIGLWYDITDTRTERDKLEATVTEKDFLMRELNHRVKNNLLMVSSLIDMKESALGRAVDLSDLRNQVNAIGKVHEALQQSDEVTHLNLQEYVAGVLSNVFQYSGSRKVTVENKLPGISVKTKAGVSIGLIVNEIATNALKHAFTIDEGHHFTVSMDNDSMRERYILTISNTGGPFPDDVDIENPRGLGLQLVSALVKQLQGTLELQRNPHPVFRIRFPVNATESS